jgi:hypothetical protein
MKQPDGTAGKRFLAVAVHAPAGHSSELVDARAAEAQALVPYLDKVAAGLPIVIAGDFNADPIADPKPNMRILLQHGYFDAAATTNRFGAKWNTFNGRNGSDGADFGYPATVHPYRYAAPRIDFIMTKGSPLTYRYTNVMHLAPGSSTAIDRGYQGTDHLLQLAEVGIRQAAPSAFPSAGTTGVPRGTNLHTYEGPCTITAASTIIDAKTINCPTLQIRAKRVSITRSVLNGTVYADPDLGLGSFSIRDSRVNIGEHAGTGIGDGNFTALRVHVTGGNRSINCYLNCKVVESYVHGQFKDRSGVYHESGIRMGSGSVIRGNRIACDAPDVPPDAGCSAALTGYGDFAVVKNNDVVGNLFVAGSGGFCSYGGSTSGKPFSANVMNIRFMDNVYQRGASGKCGWWGPITSFDTTAPGNLWSNNFWDDGTAVAAN